MTLRLSLERCEGIAGTWDGKVFPSNGLNGSKGLAVTQPGRLPSALSAAAESGAGHWCADSPGSVLHPHLPTPSPCSLESVFPLIAEGQRSATSQAMHQLFGLFVTLTFASVGGGLGGE